MKIENLCARCMMEKSHIGGKCEFCGYDSEKDTIPSFHLPPFSILAGKYLVGKALGAGGFGITYIGMDLNLQMRVAIKEYYPNGYAMRNTGSYGGCVQCFSGSMQEFFETGREKFLNEAKILAKCTELPGIVNVRDCFLENNTAYIVMEYVEGETLKDYLEKHGGKLSVEETLQLMKPVIQSLEAVHRMHLIHRDISPQNIMICKNQEVKVLDFGGAREFLTTGEKSMSIMLKPGYAPEEQYCTHGMQGPWTDVYALCATMYRCITGEIPPESIGRIRGDKLKKISEFEVNCPFNIEEGILKGLNSDRKERFQSMRELYLQLYGQAGRAERKEWQPEQYIEKETQKRKESKKKAFLFAGIFAVAVAGLLGAVYKISTNRMVQDVSEREGAVSGITSDQESASIPEATPIPESTIIAEPTPTLAPEPTPEPTPTEAPLEIHVEDEVLWIRERYQEITENINGGNYEEYVRQDGITLYRSGSEIHAITVPKGADGSSYRRFYYYYRNQLIFAYYENEDAHRFYLYDEQLIRWRYSGNALDPQDAVNYDLDQSAEYKNWEKSILEESRRLKA